jgi:hypothetical protein
MVVSIPATCTQEHMRTPHGALHGCDQQNFKESEALHCRLGMVFWYAALSAGALPISVACRDGSPLPQLTRSFPSIRGASYIRY